MITDQELLSHALGQLDKSDEARIRSQVEADPQLRKRLEQLTRSLGLLLDDGGDFDPPPGLASRTLEFVYPSSGRPPVLIKAPRPPRGRMAPHLSVDALVVRHTSPWTFGMGAVAAVTFRAWSIGPPWAGFALGFLATGILLLWAFDGYAEELAGDE